MWLPAKQRTRWTISIDNCLVITRQHCRLNICRYILSTFCWIENFAFSLQGFGFRKPGHDFGQIAADVIYSTKYNHDLYWLPISIDFDFPALGAKKQLSISTCLLIREF